MSLSSAMPSRLCQPMQDKHWVVSCCHTNQRIIRIYKQHWWRRRRQEEAAALLCPAPSPHLIVPEAHAVLRVEPLLDIPDLKGTQPEVIRAI